MAALFRPPPRSCLVAQAALLWPRLRAAWDPRSIAPLPPRRHSHLPAAASPTRPSSAHPRPPVIPNAAQRSREPALSLSKKPCRTASRPLFREASDLHPLQGERQIPPSPPRPFPSHRSLLSAHSSPSEGSSAPPPKLVEATSSSLSLEGEGWGEGGCFGQAAKPKSSTIRQGLRSSPSPRGEADSAVPAPSVPLSPLSSLSSLLAFRGVFRAPTPIGRSRLFLPLT